MLREGRNKQTDGKTEGKKSEAKNMAQNRQELERIETSKKMAVHYGVHHHAWAGPLILVTVRRVETLAHRRVDGGRNAGRRQTRITQAKYSE